MSRVYLAAAAAAAAATVAPVPAAAAAAAAAALHTYFTTYLPQGIEAAFCSEEDKAALRRRFASFYAECEVCTD